jgi:hypothetical protein
MGRSDCNRLRSPSKGEEIDHSFVTERSTYVPTPSAGHVGHLTLIPGELRTRLMNWKQIIKDMRDEKKQKVYVMSETRDYMTLSISIYSNYERGACAGTEEDLERLLPLIQCSSWIQRLM